MHRLIAFTTTLALLIAGMVLIVSSIAPTLGAVCSMGSLVSLAVAVRIAHDEREAEELEALNSEYAELPKELW